MYGISTIMFRDTVHFHETLTWGYRTFFDMKWTPENIKALRKRLGLTQKEFAEELGYARRESVAELEKGDYGPSGPTQRLLDMLERQAEVNT